MTTLAFVDTETTGLDPERHEVWEIAVIIRGHRTPGSDGEYLWQLLPDLAKAEPTALRINRYYERHAFTATNRDMLEAAGVAIISDPTISDGQAARTASLTSPKLRGAYTRRAHAAELAELLDAAHIVGSVPWFDTAFLAKYLRANGHAPSWHYHHIDVEALAVGALAQLDDPLTPPWSSDAITTQLGIPPADPADRHTALGDARWAMAAYDAALGPARTTTP